MMDHPMLHVAHHLIGLQTSPSVPPVIHSALSNRTETFLYLPIRVRMLYTAAFPPFTKRVSHSKKHCFFGYSIKIFTAAVFVFPHQDDKARTHGLARFG